MGRVFGEIAKGIVVTVGALLAMEGIHRGGKSVVRAIKARRSRSE